MLLVDVLLFCIKVFYHICNETSIVFNAQFNHKYTIYPSGCCSYDTNYNCFVFRLDPTAVFYQPNNGTNDEDVTITHSMEAEYADVEESIMVCISV